MIDRGKHNLLGIQINAIDYEAAVDRIIQAAHARQSLGVSALAVHGVMTGVLDAEQGYRLNKLDLIVPDGQPVRWALNLLYGAKLVDRVYGPNLTIYVCERAAAEGLPIYLYGSTEGVLKRFTSNLQRKFPSLQIAGSQPSRFGKLSAEEKSEFVRTITESNAAIIFVGLGCPRQEVWVYEHLGLLSMPKIAVGAAFDFHAGTLSQAPALMQRFGLEWLYRLSREPGRLWKRYLFLNPHYLTLLALQFFKLRKFPVLDTQIPSNEIRYG
jgi:N-acetylglucosaminyldiphosphoundecaprenol N-acetyl-beta-D-mannosaminyltransferase